MNNENIPQSMNKDPEEMMIEFWENESIYPSLKFRCHNWHLCTDNNNFIFINHFQKTKLVNMQNYDYLSSYPLPK